MVQPVITLFIPLLPEAVPDVAEPLIENGTIEVLVPFTGALKVQLLKVLLSALFHK